MSQSVVDARLGQFVQEIVTSYPYFRPWNSPDIAFTDLPVMDKTMINLHREQLELPCPSVQAIESFTSGSTGVPFRCVKFPQEKHILSMAMFRRRRQWGLPLKHNLLLLSNRFLAEPHMLEHYARRIVEHPPDMIQGRSSALVELAEYFAQHELKIPDKLVLLQNWGEPRQPSHRRRIEQVFGVPFVDYYGMEEIWMIAFSNQEDELEIDDQLVHVEIVDPETLQPLPDGEYGEILVTSFVMRSLPFVRYRTGDIGCICRSRDTGRTTLCLAPVRLSQIRLPNRNAQTAIFRYLDKFLYDLSLQKGIRQFQIVQESYTSFRFRIAAEDHSWEVGVLTDKFSAFLKQYLAAEVAVQVELVSEIAPHPVSGKFHPFISLVAEKGGSLI
jgi:phenylacetate-CoA ligase